MNRTTPPKAPAFEELPPRRPPSKPRSEFTVSLEIVTSIFGGGYRTRELDDIDFIRVPTVRGHLRFWWRALFAGSSAELYDAETKLWGGPGGSSEKASAVRSPVEVRIEVTDRGPPPDDSDIDPQRTDGAYVLFPARGERAKGRPPIPRRTRVAFKLTIAAPAEHIAAVRDVVRAWILFGGYGGRTRRGLGSLTVTGSDAATWLPHPRGSLNVELKRLFGRDVFAVDGPARQTPMLAGAALCTIDEATDGVAAWVKAVDALRSFRQGTPTAATASVTGALSEPSAWARQPSSDPRRPSISNWPEADKIRRLADRELSTGPYAHTPRHNDAPVWPRAGFGLPIVGRFQRKDRRGGRCDEPPDFTLTWRDPKSKGKPRDRLASPLIIKALPLAGGRFVAIALWLHRDWPSGEIVLEINSRVVPGSAAPFDALVAPGEAPRFIALADKLTLRSAFLDWLRSRPGNKMVTSWSSAGGGAR